MQSFDPNEQTERENYKLLTGTIGSRPVAFVTSSNDEGVINGAPFSYFNIVSSNPPRISLSIQRQNGEYKDTARNIVANKQFVVHIVDMDNVEKVNVTAATLPSDESEIELAGFTLVPSENITVPGVKEAKVRFECIAEQAIELQGETGIGSDFIIGKIVKFHVDEDIMDNSYIVYNQLAPVGRLAGNDYTKLGEIFKLERPK